MANAVPTKASITLNYGADNGKYTFNGLIPEANSAEAYVTALGINMVQEKTMETVTLTSESALTR